MFRKLGADPFVFDFVREMGQVRVFGTEQFNDMQGFFDREVGGVRSEAERIQDEGIEVSKEFHARWLNSVGVGAIGDVSDSKSINVAIGAVDQGDGLDPGSEDIKWLIVDRDQIQLRCCAGVCWLSFVESVVKHTNDSVLNLLGSVDRDRAPDHEGKEANVIHAVKVVRVLVGVENAVNDADTLPKQLLPKIGCGVDQKVATWQAHNCTAPGAVIARVFAEAHRTAAADGRYPYTRSRS